MAYSDPFDPAVVPVVLSSPQATAAPVSAPVPAPVLPAPAPPPAGVPLGPLPAPAPPPGTLAPWSPVGAGGAARPVISGASPELNTAIEELKGDIANRERLAGERRTAEAPLIEQGLRELDRPVPQQKQPLQPPQAPKREEIMGAGEQWLMAIATLAGVMGGRGRTHAVNAMSAMTGIVEGLAEGNRQKFEQSAKQWDMENKRITEINTQSRQAYLDEMNNRKLRAEEIDMRLRLTAQRYDDKIAESLIGNKEKLFSLIQARDQLNQTASEYTSGVRGLAGRFGGAGRPMLTQDAIDLSAAMFFVGNPNATKGMSALSGDPVAVRNRLAAAQSGVQPFSPEVLEAARSTTSAQLGYTGEQSYQRTAGSMGARVESASNEVAQLLPQAIEASRSLPRGPFVPWNTLVQKYEAGTSDPRYNDFIVANISLENAYGRAMNPQGVPRVQEKAEAHARGLLSTATSQQAYEVQLRRLALEVLASKRATAQTRQGVGGDEELNDIIKSLSSGAGAATVPGAPAAPMPNVTPGGIRWGQ